MWTDFNIADFLPNIDISARLSEKMSSLNLPDLSTLLPDFSSIGAMIEENLAAIPEKISSVASAVSEGFSQIPARASEAFSTISTTANEGLSAIQSAWGAAFPITHCSFSGGEIINLPSGTTIYPHATTMKMLNREIQNGTFDSFISPSDGLNFTGDTFSEQAIPEVAEMPAIAQNQTSTANTSNSNVTITGNTFVVRNESDINEIAFRLLELMRDSNANYAGA